MQSLSGQPANCKSGGGTLTLCYRFSLIPTFMSRLARFLSVAVLLTTAGALTSCATKTNSSGVMYAKDFDPPAKRPSNPSAVKIKISTSAQRIYVVEGNEVLLASPCSVGTSSTPTGHGTYRITNKVERRRRVSSPGAGYPMPFWMEWKPAYGMHWGYVKPYPCTHGCIRLPEKTAAKVFAMTRVGTPLIISSSHAEDATAGARLPVLDDSTLPDPPMSYMLSNKFFDDIAYKGNMFTN